MSEGWFSMHRGWRDNPIFRGEFSRADAWVWLIENACWKPARAKIKGDYIELQRGEMTFSVRFLADKWGWSKSRVDRFLDELRSESMIETRSKIGTGGAQKAGHGQSIITICNYAKYQDIAEAERDNSGTVTGTSAGQQRDKEEQGNKETRLEIEANASISNDARDPEFGFGDDPDRPVSTPAKPKPKRTANPAARRMTPDWVPGPLPPDVAALVAQWPPGRVEREAAATRDYWLTRNTKRPGWDLTFHNRIRDIHDRVLREASYGQQTKRHTAPVDRRDGIARALDRRLGLDEAAGPFGRSIAGPSEGDSECPSARLIALR